ncbi:hypothetical protein AAC387_Pa10g0193 [Persea americana]
MATMRARRRVVDCDGSRGRNSRVDLGHSGRRGLDNSGSSSSGHGHSSSSGRRQSRSIASRLGGIQGLSPDIPESRDGQVFCREALSTVTQHRLFFFFRAGRC